MKIRWSPLPADVLPWITIPVVCITIAVLSTWLLPLFTSQKPKEITPPHFFIIFEETQIDELKLVDTPTTKVLQILFDKVEAKNPGLHINYSIKETNYDAPYQRTLTLDLKNLSALKCTEFIRMLSSVNIRFKDGGVHVSPSIEGPEYRGYQIHAYPKNTLGLTGLSQTKSTEVSGQIFQKYEFFKITSNYLKAYHVPQHQWLLVYGRYEDHDLISAIINKEVWSNP